MQEYSFAKEEHEIALTEFLDGPIRGRVSRLMSLGSKRRGDILNILDHSVILNDRYAHLLVGADNLKENIISDIDTICKVPDCYAMSTVSLIDARFFSINDGVSAINAAFGGVFLSIVPGKLGIYKYEDGRIYFLRKNIGTKLN